jgi:hypothetical protein
MKRLNFILCFTLIFASLACVSLPNISLPRVDIQPTTALPANPTPTPTSTTEILLPAEITPTVELTITPLPTEVSTNTPEPTFTSLPPTPTPTPFYAVRVEAPSYLPNFTHAEKACNWFGIGGQTYDLTGQPVQGWTIVVTAQLNGEVRQWLALSGLATAFGPGGYEIELGDTPIETSGAFSIQVVDAAGHPLSEVVSFDTHSDCQSGLVVINVVQTQAILELHLPFITR